MKHFSYTLLTLLVFWFCGLQTVHAAKPDTSICLIMEGKVLNAKESPDQMCKVELILNDQVIDSLYLKGNRKKFRFDLKRNKHYIIRISKPGFVTKNICVHTHLPSTQINQFQFIFETRLAEEKENVAPPDAETQNLPVASIYFHSKKQSFYYNKAFSSYYQKQLCKPYQQ